MLSIILIIVIVILVAVLVRLMTYPPHWYDFTGGNEQNGTKYYVVPNMLDPDFERKFDDIIENTDWNTERPPVKVTKRSDATVIVHLSDRKSLDKYHTKQEYYPGTGKPIRFSLTVWGHQNPIKDIYFDHINWLEGVAESKLSLEQYRLYVVRHEMSHALGYDHVKCDETTSKNGICPVMFQSTRGCPDGYQCGFELLPADRTVLL